MRRIFYPKSLYLLIKKEIPRINTIVRKHYPNLSFITISFGRNKKNNRRNETYYQLPDYVQTGVQEDYLRIRINKEKGEKE